LRPNQFADLTTDEFVKYVHGKNGRCFSGERPKFTIGNNKKRNKVVKKKFPLQLTQHLLIGKLQATSHQ